MEFEYEVIRSPRKKTLGISVTPHQKVIIRAPHWVSDSHIQDVLHEKSHWIQKKLAYFDSFEYKPVTYAYVDGERHPYKGTLYDLVIMNGTSSQAYISNQSLVVEYARKNTPAVIKNILERWYKTKTQEHVMLLAYEMFGVFNVYNLDFPQIGFYKYKRKWGQCSSDGEIKISTHLIKAPVTSIEYVLMHEFCHLLEHNHGKGFYDLLERHMPDWKDRKKELSQFALLID